MILPSLAFGSTDKASSRVYILRLINSHAASLAVYTHFSRVQRLRNMCWGRGLPRGGKLDKSHDMAFFWSTSPIGLYLSNQLERNIHSPVAHLDTYCKY